MATRQKSLILSFNCILLCFALALGESRSTLSHLLKWQERMSKTTTIYFRAWVGRSLWYWFLCHQRSINVCCFSLKVNYMALFLPFCSFANQTQAIQMFRSCSSGTRDAKPLRKLWLPELEDFQLQRESIADFVFYLALSYYPFFRLHRCTEFSSLIVDF